MSYANATRGTRLRFVCQDCARHLQLERSSRNQQRRWISHNHVQKIAQAEDDWRERAKAIDDGRKRSMLEVLEERGFVHQITSNRDQLKKLMDNRRVGAYAGIDPTAPSMHVGHMVPFMALAWLYVHGFPVYFVLGGSTAKIGDPEGRLEARNKVARKTYTANIANMHMQLKRFGQSMETYAARRGYEKEWAWRRTLVNNSTWHAKASISNFLSQMASGIRLGPMLGRDSVKNRQEKGDGMSVAEFVYPLMQAWDWWHLFKNGVQVQIGGADQFGNILQGAEAVKYASSHDADFQVQLEQEEKVRAAKRDAVVTDDPIGWTVPLLTTASGEKFGKSAGNAIWLDKDMTSSFDLYQFFLRSADADVERYLKLFTFIPLDEIQELMKQHEQDQSKRIPQHRLAKEFVELIHGLGEAEMVEEQHRNLFKKGLTVSEIQRSISKSNLDDLPGEAERPADIHPLLNKHAKPQDMASNSSTQVTLPRSLVQGEPLSRILYSCGLAASKSEGQRLVNAGGVYIGAKSSGKDAMEDGLSYVAARETSAAFVAKYIIDDNLLILRTGKWRVKVIEIIPDEEYDAARLTCPGWPKEKLIDYGKDNFVPSGLHHQLEDRKLG